MAVLNPVDLPNYRHPDYSTTVEQLTVLQDVYNGLEKKKALYLPQEEKEPKRAYDNRVMRSTFNNRLRPTIDSNAGLLTNFELTDLPPTVEDSLTNIDGVGSNYKAFFYDADIASLRDGIVYILVDKPASATPILTEADRLTNTTLPYLKLIDRRNVINWRTHWEAGKLIVDMVVITMVETVADGAFGSKNVTVYHQMERKQTRDENGTPMARVQHTIWEIDDAAIAAGIKQDPKLRSRTMLAIDEIPIVAYPNTSKPFNVDVPPFLKMARMNVKLFQKESALDEIERRVNCPTVFRKHPNQEIPQQLPPITFGASWVIEIPQGGEVGVLEIQGQGIAALQASINKLKEDIDSESMAFLSGSTVERTATEAYLNSSQIQSTLQGMAREKSSAIERIFDMWCKYTGEENGTQITMDANLLNPPMDAQTIATMLQLWQANVLDKETLLELLKSGKALPPNLDVQQILQRSEQERERQMQAAMDQAQAQMEMELANSIQQQQAAAQIQAENAPLQ